MRSHIPIVNSWAALASTLFVVSLSCYLFLSLLEEMLRGFITFHVPLAAFVLLIFLSGLLMAFLAPQNTPRRMGRITQLMIVIVSGIVAATIVFVRLIEIDWHQPLIAIGAGIVMSTVMLFMVRE